MKRLFSLSVLTDPSRCCSFLRVAAPVMLLALFFTLAACGGGGGGGGGSGNGGGTGSTDCILDTSAKLDSCKVG